MSTEITARKVLESVERYIAEGRTLNIDKVYNELSIFDWWTDNLSVTRLKQMRQFLRTAIRLGFDGYVCFKVGVTGCANGMWAYKELSTDGYSPKDTDVLYHSFTPAYSNWDICLNGKWMFSELTLRDVENACLKRKGV